MSSRVSSCSGQCMTACVSRGPWRNICRTYTTGVIEELQLRRSVTSGAQPRAQLAVGVARRKARRRSARARGPASRHQLCVL